MKRNALEFVRRGMIACGFGPMILAVVYLLLQREGVVESLTVDEVCRGIFSLSALAFIAGGMNIIYQIERLPLMVVILIHGGVLYIAYLCTYLLNGWLQRGVTPVLVYTCIFVLCYLVIWAFIYTVTKRKTQRLNELLRHKRQGEMGRK